MNRFERYSPREISGQGGKLDKPVRWRADAAAQFSDPEMVKDYKARDPYSPEVAVILNRLMENDSKRILDVGCGSGDLTILLASIAQQIDGLDISEPMLAEARRRSEGMDQINWMHGKLEDLNLSGKYDLVTAGDSIHWMDWPIFFPVLRELMQPNASLAILDRFKGHTPWYHAVKALCDEYYTEADNTSYNVVDELEKRDFFTMTGSAQTQPYAIEKTIEDYIHERHSRNGSSRTRLGEQKTKEFDAKLTEILSPYADEEGYLSYDVMTRIRWGVVR